MKIKLFDLLFPKGVHFYNLKKDNSGHYFAFWYSVVQFYREKLKMQKNYNIALTIDYSKL